MSKKHTHEHNSHPKEHISDSQSNFLKTHHLELSSRAKWSSSKDKTSMNKWKLAKISKMFMKIWPLARIFDSPALFLQLTQASSVYSQHTCIPALFLQHTQASSVYSPHTCIPALFLQHTQASSVYSPSVYSGEDCPSGCLSFHRK